jgi:cysteine synthase A
MINDAEKRGVLKPGGTLVEPTSGNTGIGLAYASAARGYKLIVTMPESYSVERVKLLQAFGAQVELTPAEQGMTGAIRRAGEIVEEHSEYFMPQQFKNPANPRVHFETTGPEIYNDLDGKVDVFVAGVGTGGTITGVSRYLKEVKGLDVECVAVEPAKSAVLSGENPGPHPIDGIGAGFIPDILDITLIDRIEKVTDEEAFAYARRLTREEGILSGISCGAATAAAVRLAQLDEFEDKNIVVILPDSGERYLSTVLFESYFLNNG